ncbi:MAG: NAD(P)-binding oxidoreductase [Paracoccaceae bacterium]
MIDPKPKNSETATILVAGATGATGQQLVAQLLQAGAHVRAIVRTPESLTDSIRNHRNLTIIRASILDIDPARMAQHVNGCSAVISCLGHNLNFKGLFGAPRQLCTNATRNLCRAIDANVPDEPVRFILMNTVAVKNPDSDARRTFTERSLQALLRVALPPHRDNENAATYLRQQIGNNSAHIEWCAVRPDTLINADVSDYVIQQSPVTNLLSGRPTSRANVAQFMVALTQGKTLWQEWKFRMPVVMNALD